MAKMAEKDVLAGATGYQNGYGALEGARGYLSGPIQYDTTGHNWRTDPSKVLREEFRINLFDPFDDPKQNYVAELMKAQKNRDFDTIVEITKNFVRKDLAMVDRADFVIAYLPHKVPTTGTHHEIINSSNAKKPTLLVCPTGKEFVPLWYYGFISPDYMFDNWECLFEYLADVDRGAHKDDDKWAFRYGLI